MSSNCFTKAGPSDEDPKSLRGRVRAIILGTGVSDAGEPIARVSQNQLATYAGVSPAAISTWLDNKYPANPAILERKVADVIKRLGDPDLSPLRKSDQDGKADAWFTNNIVTRVHGTFKQAIKNQYLCGLIGEPGEGKSIASKMFVRDNPSSLYIALNRAMGGGTPTGIMDAFFRFIDTNRFRKQSRRDVWLCEQFTGANRLIVVDNAEILTTRGLDWILGFYDQTASPIALVGNNELIHTLRQLQRAPSRVYPLVNLDFGASAKEAKRAHEYVNVSAEFFVKGHWPEAIGDEEVLDLSRIILTKQGRLRALEKLIRTARSWIGDPAKKFKTPADALRAAMSKHVVDYKLAA